MKKGFLLILLEILVIFTVFGQDIDKEELEKNIPEVEFINYLGSYNIIESKKDIMSIGTSLGEIISKGQEGTSTDGKYRILHLVDPTEPEKLAADIIFLGKNSQVDHIRNLRLIIAAYLQKAHNIEEENAFILAKFITFYNAAYRGNIDFFEKKYINKVSTSISKENAGIDVHYSNWPGKTALVIPLTPFGSGKDQNAVTPDPFELTDEKVMEDLKKEEDMGLDDRKQITELQEEKVEQEKKALEEKQKEVAVKEEVVKEKEKEIEEKENEIEEKVAKGEITKKEAEKQQEQLEEKKEVVEKEKDIVAEEQKAIEDGKKEIEKKEDKISESREDIAKDQNTLLEKEAESTTLESESDIAFPVINGEVAKFVFFNPKDKTITEPADSLVIGSRIFIETASVFVIPAQDANGKFVLTSVSSKDLTIIEQSVEEIYPSTYMLKDGNFIYCVVKSSDKWVIAKYSNNLELEAFSSIEANPATFIIKAGNILLYQNKSGSIISVNFNTLQ